MVVLVGSEPQDLLLTEELLYRNKSLPVKVQHISVDDEQGLEFRDSFIQQQIESLFDSNHTLDSFLTSLETTATRFKNFGIFENVSYKLDLAEDLNADELLDPNVLNLNAAVHLQRAKQQYFNLKTHTTDDHAGLEFSTTLSNVLGGDESITLSTFLDHFPRSQKYYSATFDSPVFNSGTLRYQLSGHSQSKSMPWASHSQMMNGATVKLVKECLKSGTRTEIGAQAVNRVVHGISNSASDSVRVNAGDSLKTSIFGKWSVENDLDLIPESKSKYKAEVKSEYAIGYPDSKVFGDISFLKTVASGSFYHSLNGLELILSGSSGLLCSKNQPSTSIIDRFYLGGIRIGSDKSDSLLGFDYNGLGPKDYEDTVGGNGFVQAGAKAYAKLPWVTPNSPLKLMLFSNAATLQSLDVQSNKTVATSISQLLKSSFSTTVGVGLTYLTPFANLELAYSIPLRTNPQDAARTGLQFGVTLELP